MNKLTYILKQLSKTNKKNFENYVVTRIYHLLKRTDVKLITQQYVNRKEGHALTDMYFPQLDLHVEIDEAHHEQIEISDLSREIDIIQATDHEIRRIKISQDIDDVNAQIDALADYINNKIVKYISVGSWEPWDLDKEFNPEYYRDKGYLDVSENPSFRRIVDACNCLGQNYQAVQRAWFKSKVYHGHYLWFPKFYENDDWDNSISADRQVITERCKIKKNYNEWYKRVLSNPVRRITFPRRIDNLGFKLYRFEGIFETDLEGSSFENGVIHRLVDERIDIV